ncbi:hypothetical protein [Methylibium sp.]|uniref:hypothetical protein n=1 Tax=Methylibium sp. TaxID=2067992 RepID=UPI003D106020
MADAPKSQDVNQAVALSDEDRDVFYTALMEYAYNDSHSIRQQDCAAALADRADYMQIVATEHQATALRGEPEAAGHGSVEGDVRALRQMVADCDVYLKEGETPAQRIDRERRDTEAVLNLLIREKQRTEAMREVMLRMMAGIDHLAEIARQWEPDYSSGADRRGWVLAKDARDDAARLIPETHQAASGCSHTARSDVLSIDVVEQRLLTWRQSFMNKSGDRLALDDFMGQESIDDLIDFVCSPPAQSAEQGATPPAPVAPLGDGEQLWMWQNGDHFLAFRHLYPCFSPGGDPMTLGEPFGRAIFKHSHNRQGKPNEQQRTDRQSPRSSTDPDLQRRQAASAGQACSVGAGASLGHSQHPIAPQGGWGAGDDGARSQSVPDIAGAAGVLAAAGNVAEGVAALAASPQPAAPVEDLAMMIRMLVSSLKRHWPHAPQPNDLPSRAMELLRRHGLQGSPLREADDGGPKQSTTAAEGGAS